MNNETAISEREREERFLILYSVKSAFLSMYPGEVEFTVSLTMV